jgi:predicted ATP-grasp superfamily ATP-dependent carboligase
MARTVLLTLGRLPKGLDLARSFAQAGWRVVVAEPFRRHLVGASNVVARSVQVTAPVHDRAAYLADLRRVIVEEGVELVVPVSEETMHVAFLRDSLPPGVRLLAMPAPLLLALHDKESFIERCAQLGLPAPATARLGTTAAQALADSGPVVVKPALSCSGRGVQMLPRGAALPRPGAQRQIVQRRLDGAVMSSCTLAHAGESRVTVIYRAALLSGTVAVCFERVASQPSIERWVRSFIAQTAFDGFVSFDFVVDAAGEALPVECNPRATSGLHFIEGADLAPALIEPQHAPPPRLRAETLLQQFYSCLTETQKAVFNPARRGHALRCLLRARDVSWSWRDPWPFLSMTWTSWEIIRRAWQAGTTFGEVATLDVGWYEDAPVSTARPRGTGGEHVARLA